MQPNLAENNSALPVTIYHKLLRTFLTGIGVNRAIVYFLMGKGFSFIASPVTLYLIATYLSPEEQGYYYTFSSLLGLSIFFELGLGTVITQFASHEYAHLKWNEGNSLTGDEHALYRLLSLLRKSLKWYALITGLCIAVIFPAGWYFLQSKPESAHITYFVPWLLLVFSFGVSTCTIPLTSALEGCGKISEVQQLRVLQSVAGALLVWATIKLNGRLFAASVEFIAYMGVILVWLLFRHKRLIAQILHLKKDQAGLVSWSKEIFPMQWRIAVSWLAAYFTNYLFIPLLFAYRGAVEAGKMGMSLKISGIVFTLSMAWINTRIPSYGALIQKKQYDQLDSLAVRSAWQAVAVGAIFSVSLILGLFLFGNRFPKYHDRTLPAAFVACLCVASLANVATSAIGGYLRAHKEEPLMVNSVIVALLVGASSYLTARYFDANMMTVAYAAIVVLFGIPAFYRTLALKRSAWHHGGTSA